MTLQLPKKDTCQTCALKVAEKDDGLGRVTLYCRRFPPQMLPVYMLQPMKAPNGRPMLTPDGQPMGQELVPVGHLSSFPEVRPDWWCKEHLGVNIRPELLGETAGRS